MLLHTLGRDKLSGRVSTHARAMSYEESGPRVLWITVRDMSVNHSEGQGGGSLLGTGRWITVNDREMDHYEG